MAGPIFLPAHNEGSGSPLTRHYQHTSGASFIRGAPLGITSGEVAEHAGGATVTGIVGIAATNPLSSPGNYLPNSNKLLQVTGMMLRDVAVHPANRSQVFYGILTNGSAVAVVPTITDLRTYGYVKQADGTWTVDKSDVTDVVLKIVRIDPLASDPLVWFKFIESSLLFP